MNQKSRRLYRTIGFAIIIFAIAFIVNTQLRKAGNRISGEYLKELIAKESKGLYKLQFDEIDLNIFKKSVEIKNIELYATPENREDSINARNIYEAQVSDVKISLESVIRIYTDKELVVDGIEVIDPKVLMTKINPEKEPLKFGRETGELYDVISQYLDLLQINFLKVRSGTVNHSPSNFRLKAIDFSVEDFTVSQDRKKKKIFYSEAINLGVNQQAILLPDSIHQLSFDGFELSTKDSLLNFTNFKITARTDVNAKNVFEEQNQNVYDIGIPVLELKGINYLKAYEDNYLIVERVNIPKPQINIHSVLKSKKLNTEQAENSIGASLLALFDLIRIKDFKIEEGALNLTLKGDNQQRFLSDNISIGLFNIELDSNQRDIQNILNYFENASVEINDYDYLLPDNLHNIKFEKLKFNTLEANMLVQNLEIRPSRSLEDSTLTQYNLNLPILEIDGISHRDIYDNSRIDLEKLVLRNAQIKVTPPYLKQDDEQRSMITPHRLYEILNKNFSEIKLDKFSVLDSDLDVGEAFIGKALNIRSHYLKIDSTLQSWHQIADSSFINGQQLEYKLKDGHISVNNFESKNNLHSLDLTELKFNYVNLRDQISIDYLSFRGVELDSILNKKKFNIDSITLFKPNIKISYKDLQKQSKQKREWTFPDKPINILLTSGSLDYQIDDHKNLSVGNFDVELNYQNQLKVFEVLAEDLLIEDSELGHQINLSKLSLPKNQDRLLLKQIELRSKSKNNDLAISAKIPSIKFINFNKDALFQNETFEADSLITSISQVNYLGSSKINDYFGKEQNNKSDFKFTVKNAKIEIKNATINLMQEGDKTSRLLSSNATLDIENFSYPKRANQKLPFAKNVNINNEILTFFNSNKDTIHFQNLSYNSINNDGEIKSFSFKGADTTTSLKIEDVKLKNANLTEYLDQKTVNIEKFTSKKTNFNFAIKDQSKSKFPEKIRLPFSGVNISQLVSKDINIVAYYPAKQRNFYIRKADLSIGNLSIDSILKPKEIHHHIKSLVFSGKEYKESFGKHYTVSADKYTFTYPASDFEAQKIKMRSKYDRFEYSKHIKYQNDWFKLDINSLKLDNLNIDSLLVSEKFIVSKLNLTEGDFTIFRDLNVPHNDDRLVPMPQQVLSTFDLPFSIDSVFVNSDIHIHIVPKESAGIGTMVLNIDSGHIFNMRTHHFKNTKPMVLQAEGKLNQTANFKTRVDFPIPSAKGEFRFIGNISSMDLKILNEMLIPLGAIEVRSGANESVDFNFTGNEDYAEGLMEFRYNNLKIDILDRDTYQSKGFGNNLKTIFANSFVVANKNPRWFKLQEGDIFFERIKSRSIFNLWAKALLSGAVSSIGINRSKEEAKAYYKENKQKIEE